MAAETNFFANTVEYVSVKDHYHKWDKKERVEIRKPTEVYIKEAYSDYGLQAIWILQDKVILSIQYLTIVIISEW